MFIQCLSLTLFKWKLELNIQTKYSILECLRLKSWETMRSNYHKWDYKKKQKKMSRVNNFPRTYNCLFETENDIHSWFKKKQKNICRFEATNLYRNWFLTKRLKVCLQRLICVVVFRLIMAGYWFIEQADMSFTYDPVNGNKRKTARL